MDEKPKKKIGWCGIVLIVLLLLSVTMVGLAVHGYNSLLNQIQRPSESEPTLSLEEIQAIEKETDAPEEIPEDATIVEEEDVTMPTEDALVIEENDNIINILLIGQDRRPGQGRQRSDTMILCTIDTQDKTLVMTSFLRDLYVDLPDWNGYSYQDNRLNACYAFGGMGMLDAALKKNFGVVVDHNIEVDFSGFEKIINLIGGVNIYLTKAEANYLDAATFKEGVNYLNAHHALRFARIRKLDSDFGRTERQRRLLTSILASVKNLSYDQLTNLVNNMLPMITTDMSNSDITNYMLKILPILPELQISTQHIPAPGTYRSVYIRGMAVLVPDMSANIALLRRTLN